MISGAPAARAPLYRSMCSVTDPARAAVWCKVRRLLAIRMDNLGDVLMTTPALAAAAASVPDLRITLLGGPAATALAAHLPMVEEVIAARVPWVRHAGDELANDDLTLAEQLRGYGFDAAVIFTVCTQSALPAAMLCRLAGIPLRLAHVRENPYNVLSDWVPELDLELATARHEVRRQLDLIAHVGWQCKDERLRFALRAADVRRVDTLLAGEPTPGSDQPLVVVHVGASAPSRRWPAERFGIAADEIIRVAGARVVYTGSLDELPLIHMARAAMRRPSFCLAGQLSLGELAALLARARVIITNNSGPAHIASAVGAPVVDLYALTNPQHTPWQVRSRVLSHDVPCRNCLKSSCPQGHHLCLRGISHQAVVAAALDLLRHDKSGGYGSPLILS